MRIRVYSAQRSVTAAAQQALSHRLYVSGWELSYVLRDVRGDGEGMVALAYKEGVPIGVLVVRRSQMHIFIRQTERRQGIGAKLVRAVWPKLKTKPCGGFGIHGSMEFWKAVNVCTS